MASEILADVEEGIKLGEQVTSLVQSIYTQCQTEGRDPTVAEAGQIADAKKTENDHWAAIVEKAKN